MGYKKLGPARLSNPKKERHPRRDFGVWIAWGERPDGTYATYGTYGNPIAVSPYRRVAVSPTRRHALPSVDHPEKTR
jgi:hypothetical protein